MEENYLLSEDSEDEGQTVDKDVVINNKEAMESLLAELKSNLDWVEKLDITVDMSDVKIPGEENNDDKKQKPTNDIQDEFKREMRFYCQAQVAAKEGLAKLNELGVPTQRPEDYFAEMVKSDIHMQKIRHKLMARKESLEKSEKAKKQRQLKKIGKKVQQDVLKKRQEEKKKMLNAVDKIKKGKGKFDKLEKDEDIFSVSTTKEKDQRKPNMKRKRKDDKFGFGGKKRKVKKNSAESAAETSSFKKHVHGAKPFQNKNKSTKSKSTAKNKRLGKSRRMKTSRR